MEIRTAYLFLRCRLAADVTQHLARLTSAGRPHATSMLGYKLVYKLVSRHQRLGSCLGGRTYLYPCSCCDAPARGPRRLVGTDSRRYGVQVAGTYIGLSGSSKHFFDDPSYVMDLAVAKVSMEVRFAECSHTLQHTKAKLPYDEVEAGKSRSPEYRLSSQSMCVSRRFL